ILVTHDTESLDLCDLMIFLASGRTVYLGPPREAKSYFGVESIADVYSRVEEEDSADAWEEAYRKSELHERYVERRSTDGEEPPLQRQQEPREAIPRTQKTGLSGWRRWQVLLRRSLELLLRDRLTLALIMLQAPILAILLDLIALLNGLTHLPGIDVPLTELKDLPRELTGLAIPALPLLMAASVTWVGSMNACREIVKEVAIFRRERIAGLKILPYVSSKVAVLAALSIVQVTIFFAIVAARVN